ncbi:MAG: CRISPR-associated protein Cas5 [Dehalococcoidales bacterium]|nr:CRISPR-associated protein Cas5 [Dehalococcoidales bacterium]
MRVLKVEAEGLTTSFRYPHFMQGVHPTFEMPPPATIYGHICSALGEWVSPDGVEFAYHFSYKSQFDDVEHVHILAAATGRMPGTSEPKVMEGAVNPFKRAVLFQPRLVLYINRPDWEDAFRSPHYPVVLGRSQDLFTYTKVSVIELQRSTAAYFEHTLAPYHMALQAVRGYVVLMPRFLDYQNKRAPTFARYLVLQRRARAENLLRFEGLDVPSTFWTDPSSPEDDGAHLGLTFHSFVGDYNDSIGMA